VKRKYISLLSGDFAGSRIRYCCCC